MTLKYARFKIFRALLEPFSKAARSKRMNLFYNKIGPMPGDRIIDLGGLPDFWKTMQKPVDITVLNLPGTFEPAPEKPIGSGAIIRTLAGDACNVRHFKDNEFDIVFSNSVIEHVGDRAKQEAFSKEARRLGLKYWVQTPSIWFPIEAHNGMPFWWFYPESVRRWFRERWRQKLPKWTEMIDGTTVISRKSLQRMFPEAQIHTERYLGIPKSYIVIYNPEDRLSGRSRT